MTGRGGSAILLSIVISGLALSSLAEPVSTESESRTPIAEVYGETIYVEDVEGALAFRIYKHHLDIYSLLKSEAEARIDERLLAKEAKNLGTTVEALLMQVEGGEGVVSEVDVDAYLAEHPPVGERDAEKARIRVRHYLSERARLARRVDFMERLREQAGVKILLLLPTPPRTEVDVAGAPMRGPGSAKIEIVHFASFGSRNSARSARKIELLREAFPDQIQQVHRNLLSDRDELGLAAARIAFAAVEVDQFWPLHDRLFGDDANRLTLEGIEAIAIELGVPVESVRSAGTDPARIQAVKRDIDAANAAGAPREPALFINGRFVSGLMPYDEIKKIVTEETERTKNSDR
jgi:hypothetical protein